MKLSSKNFRKIVKGVGGAILFAIIESASAAPPPAEFVAGEVLVVISTEAEPSDTRPLKTQLMEMESTLPGQITKSIQLGSKRLIYKVKLPAGVRVEETIRKRPSHHRILKVEPNYILHGDDIVPNDPSYSLQWGLTNIGAPQAWNLTTGDPSIVVAIVDSGVLTNHQDLAPNLWHGWNFIDNNNDPSDQNGHGTHVSGIVGALGNNNVAGAGVAWHVRLMPCRVLDASLAGTTDNAVEAIHYAVDNGARIINGSFDGPNSQSLHDAIAYAGSHNVMYVCSAGNNGANIDQTPDYPSSYSDANIVSVASVGKAGQLSSFSNYGNNNVDLAAPGEGIVSTGIGSNSAIATLSGTSQAAPFVTGVVALMLSINPSLSISQLKAILLSSGDALPSLAGKTVSGRRVNVFNAVISSQPGAIWVDFAYVGSQQGSFTQPFNTFAGGLNAVNTGGTIMIKSGSSSETPTISKPVTIMASGGVATVGQ